LIWIKATLDAGTIMHVPSAKPNGKAGVWRIPALARERFMKAGKIMTRKVSVVSPDDTVENAAILMARINSGILPVLSGTRVVGLITDRDIVVRAVAAGKPVAACTVGDVMTEDVHYCLKDHTVEDVAKRMGDLGVRRMPVFDRSNILVGIISLDDLAAHVQWEHTVDDALRNIAQFSRAPRSL
jgi:CBS domain-containing protein